jgi:hypothetical protein
VFETVEIDNLRLVAINYKNGMGTGEYDIFEVLKNTCYK